MGGSCYASLFFLVFCVLSGRLNHFNLIIHVFMLVLKKICSSAYCLIGKSKRLRVVEISSNYDIFHIGQKFVVQIENCSVYHCIEFH